MTILMLLSLITHSYAQQPVEFDVWQDRQPMHTSTLTAPQGVNEQGHITNCQRARIELYIPEGGAEKTVLICPGGGYAILAVEHEGRQFARFLCENGIAAAVLSYRMPNGVAQIPLEDAEQALKILKKKSRALGVNSKKIGVMGFSAGGHLASNISVRLNPAFSVLFYPVISSDSAIIHAGSFRNFAGGNRELYEHYSSEKLVTRKTPPTLLFHSLDDTGVPVGNSQSYRDALRTRGIHAELILFDTGGHGWGFDSSFAFHEMMKIKLVEWIKAI